MISSNESEIRILLVDDHALFRSGIGLVISRSPHFCLVGEASDGIEAFVKCEALKPDMVLMDINMPESDGLVALRKIKTALPKTKVIMLTAAEDDASIHQALRDGADGYLLKDINPEKLCESLLAAANNESVLADAVTKRLIEETVGRGACNTVKPPIPKEYLNLTRQERRVLTLIARGCSNKEIAGILFVAENTVKIHLRNILKKLNLDNRIQAAVFAVSNGLDKDEDVL